MPEYKATIGLEVHAELKTSTKMFCRCKNDPDEKRPNWNICPVCTAQPGSLPVINKKAVEHVLRVGKAVGATLADFTEWDRKNYFYPDIPKGYQISQYKYPLVSGGELAGVLLTRIHLEEDTGTSKHDRGDYSLIDFNRAGVPLMELVTEPVIHDAETAMRFAKELQLLLRYLGASDANMEKGEMRVEANVSIAAIDTLASADDRRLNAEGRGMLPNTATADKRRLNIDNAEAFLPRVSASRPRNSAVPLGTKVEVKNLNSFKSVGDAIAFEIKRHAEVLARGEKVVQETRGWDENAGKTFSQRKKESANDYRYFPEPDLPKLMLKEVFGEQYEKLPTLPELPWEKRERLKKEFGFQGSVVETYVGDSVLGGFFEDVAGELGSKKELVTLASNYVSSDLAALMKSGLVVGLGKVTPKTFADLMLMLKNGVVSSRGAKDTLAKLFAEGGEARAVAESCGLIQQSDAGALEQIVKEIIATNEKVAAEYKAGKEASLQFLIGQGMKASKGSANPQVLGELFQKALK
ncbi:MAG: Asp-tRNA(Asn)/Glu-tRNA(Gln) amidotransferase subunit GatB [bacterium]|nr:Asp-tRNA(Asn)/Glu-tRNA(Gln) amidotransferase subunit GatB [bacterium]